MIIFAPARRPATIALAPRYALADTSGTDCKYLNRRDSSGTLTSGLPESRWGGSFSPSEARSGPNLGSKSSPETYATLRWRLRSTTCFLYQYALCRSWSLAFTNKICYFGSQPSRIETSAVNHNLDFAFRKLFDAHLNPEPSSFFPAIMFSFSLISS